MNMRRNLGFLAFFSLLSCAAPLRAETPEEMFTSAIRLSNQGRKEEAIRILQELSKQSPNDDRYLLSLGMVYRSLDQYENAVAAFERAVQIRPSEEGYYSLGLLYEGMATRADPPRQKDLLAKARNAWSGFLRLNPSDTKKREVAERHIKNLSN